MDINTNTIYYTSEDISTYDTTGILTEEDIWKMKEILADDFNCVFTCQQDC